MKSNLIIQGEFNIVGRGLVFTVIPSENKYKYDDFNQGDIVSFKNKNGDYEIVGVEMFRQSGKVLDNNPIGLNVKVYEQIIKDSIDEDLIKSSLDSVIDISVDDYSRNIARVKKAIRRVNGDQEKEIELTENMAKKITDIDKAYGNYLAAEELNLEHLTETYLNHFKYLLKKSNNQKSKDIKKILKKLK